MKLFLAYFTKALQKRDGPTDGRTDTRSSRDARTHLKIFGIFLNLKHVFLGSRRTDWRIHGHVARPALDGPSERETAGWIYEL